MKKLIILCLFFVGSKSFAMVDVERGILFMANYSSLGTYIAQMEGEIAQIKLEYAKKLAETNLAFEQDRQAYLKLYLSRQQAMMKSHRDFLTNQLESLKKRTVQFEIVVQLSQELFRRLLDKESLLEEIQKLNALYPGIQDEWNTFIEAASPGKNQESLSSTDLEQILLQAVELNSQALALQTEIEDEITQADADLSRLEKKLEAMK